MNTGLLIATVGGSPEPIVATLLKWRPARTIFIASPETRSKVSDEIMPGVQANGWPDFDAGRWVIEEISDAQDYSAIVARMNRVENCVTRWKTDNPDAEVLADITGGTKPMSCALASAAARWPACKITYVGGAERNKNGVGIVVTGKEQIVESPNPWEALGRPVLDLALALLRKNSSAAATALLKEALPKIQDACRKAEVSAFASLAEALAEWERFSHKSALNKLTELSKHANNLEAVLGYDFAPSIKRAKSHLESITNAPAGTPGIDLTLDLLANAQRRIREGRYDDAVARLYRAIAAFAQAKLHEHGFADTASMPLAQVPEPLHSEWKSRAENDTLKLGLQDGYRLLDILGDEAADRFKRLELDHPQRSLLVTRNSSILAHGYAPVGKETAEKLLAAALKLSGLTEADLALFPTFEH